MNTEYDRLQFSTQALPEQERLNSWRLLMHPLFSIDVMEGDAVDFHAQAQVARLDCCLVARLEGGAQQLSRTRGQLAVGGLKEMLVLVCLEGHGIIEVDGHASPLSEGDVGILDMARPAVCTLRPFRFLVLIMPRDRIARLLAGGSPHGFVIQARSALSIMIRNHVSVMAEIADTLTAVEAADILDAIILLLERGLRTVGDTRERDRMTLKTTLRLAVQDYVESHLIDHDLSPERLAAVFRMSRATLYRLFEEEGGVAGFIQTRRLDRCFAELARSRRQGRPIGVGELAYTYGFGSDAHFSRVFRRRFGITPREARESGATPDSKTEALGDSQRLRLWLDGLGTQHAIIEPPALRNASS